MLHGLSARIGVQCPFNSSLGEFQAIGTASGILEYRPCWCPSPFPSPSISRCFSIRSPSPAIEFHSCFFFTIDVSVSDLYLMYSVDPSLTHFLGEFPGLGLALVHIYKNSDWMLLNRNSSYLLTGQITRTFYLTAAFHSKHLTRCKHTSTITGKALPETKPPIFCWVYVPAFYDASDSILKAVPFGSLLFP